MNRKGIIFSLLLLALCTLEVTVIEFVPNVGAYTLHEPISIRGDSDFIAQATTEGWPGNGTEECPYIIEGYEIK